MPTARTGARSVGTTRRRRGARECERRALDPERSVFPGYPRAAKAAECGNAFGAQILVDPTRAERIATLGRLGGTRITGEDRAFRVESRALAFARAAPSPAPDPKLVRKIIRQRQLRARFFDPELFADPAWDILLDLTAARAEHARVSVTSLCIASGVPPTTALRWIGQMIDSGLLKREQDDMDRRRAFVALTDDAADAMAHYFAEFDQSALQLA